MSCLVLDGSLPGLIGIDLQKRVAVERPDMPIIFIMTSSKYVVLGSGMVAGYPAVSLGVLRFEESPGIRERRQIGRTSPTGRSLLWGAQILLISQRDFR